MKRVPLIAALVLAACGGETVEVDVGYRGEARANPMLAAERFTTAMGLPARSFGVYPGVPPPDAALVTPIESVAYEGHVADDLRAWVEGGGHLILLLTHFQSRWEEIDGVPRFGVTSEGSDVSERARDWLDWIGVRTRDRDIDADGFEMPDGEELELSIAASRVLVDDTRESIPPIVGKRYAAHLLTYERGAGVVQVLSSGAWLQNESVGERDNADFLWHLLSETGAARAWFVYGSRPGLWSLVWNRAWTVVIAGLALLALWLWRASARFGPLLADPPPARRDFGEHVVATGRYLWSQRASGALLEAARRRLERQLERAAPEVAELDRTRIAHDLAKRTGLPAARCRDALFGSATNDAATFTRYVHDLRRIRESL